MIWSVDLARRSFLQPGNLEAFHTFDGIVPPHLTPHNALVHRILFYRGSFEFQVLSFNHRFHSTQLHSISFVLSIDDTPPHIMAGSYFYDSCCGSNMHACGFSHSTFIILELVHDHVFDGSQ